MKYNIKEVHAAYDNGKIKSIAVLWADGDMYRATYASLKSHHQPLFTKDTELTSKLIERIAGYGHYLTELQKQKYFPHIKNWSR
ncbi:MAG: hypothetical protein RBT46_04325 [Weeksellaceae bacterium]|jgi:hypothetical protein|nr:hypothetical protein [Weeksellaceae bacterium]MDX9704918.1 hypothetical protein [Weeksellaceae bacterium]